jgi:hypothetical protein
VGAVILVGGLGAWDCVTIATALPSVRFRIVI